MAYLPFFVPQGADGNWAGEEALILVTSGVDGRVWRAHHPLTTQNTQPPRALSACVIGISAGWVWGPLTNSVIIEIQPLMLEAAWTHHAYLSITAPGN